MSSEKCCKHLNFVILYAGRERHIKNGILTYENGILTYENGILAYMYFHDLLCHCTEHGKWVNLSVSNTHLWY